MGDFFAPKRRDVVDRLRRRIEQYRHRHIHCLGRLNVGRLGLHEQQKHDTEVLHQRWLENKARKAKQSSKASKDSGGGGGGNTNSSSQSDHRNLVTQKLKQKIDATTTANNEGSATNNAATNATDNIFQFDDNDHHHQPPPPPPNGTQTSSQTTGVTSSHVSGGTSNVSSSTNVGVTGGGTDGSLPHLSVQIVQQISSQRQSPQTIHTNVTVSSTRYPPPQISTLNSTQPDSSPINSNSNAHPAAAHGAGNINVHTSTSTQQLPHGGSGVCANTTTTATLGIGSGNRPPNSLPGLSGETSVHTSIECKQEPVDDVQCEVSRVLGDVSNSVTGGPVPDLPFDEIQFFLESIENNDGDLIKELNDFDKIYHKVQKRAENSCDSSVFSPLDGCDSPGLTKATASFSDQVPPPHHHPGVPPAALTPTMFEAPQTMGGMVGTGLPLGHAPPLVEPTGPAAETLKQMAAQHQQTSGGGSAGFPGKGLDSHYPDPYDHFGRSRNGYPTVYTSQCYPPGGYTGYGQTGYADSTSPMGPYVGAKPDLTGMGYSQTKPLTHYPTDGHGMGGAGAHSGQPSGPSSLQQLQNQVASHFSPMHITQTQQVRMAQGHRHVHLSQTQQVQMAAAAAAAAAQQQQLQQGPPPGMTVSQQQSFSMGGGPPPHMQSQTGQGQPPGMSMSARDMQLMQEKMRREQQQYMNRPPPEYKLHPTARSTSGPPYQAPSSAAGVPHTSSGGSTTPLQTMQNMVNQTPPYPTSIKAEAGTCSTGNVMAHQMSSVQSMAASVGTTGPHLTMTQASQSMSFQQQQQQSVPQRPPSYSPSTTCTTPNGVVTTTNSSSSGAAVAGVSSATVVSLPHASTTSSSASSSAPTTSSQVVPSSGYTSALMRNQRPPNVNVGPEGLNISQPRVHPGHHPSHPHFPPHMHPHPAPPHGGADGGWPARPMMQAGGGAMSTSMGQTSAIMPPGYAHRPGSTGSGMAGVAGGGALHPGMMGQAIGGSQVMMHQTMQMQQGMGMRGGVASGGHTPQSLSSHSAPYNTMMGPGSMQTQSSTGTPPTQQYSSAGLAQDDFMQFFNSEQSHNFDSLSSDLFDDILK